MGSFMYHPWAPLVCSFIYFPYKKSLITFFAQVQAKGRRNQVPYSNPSEVTYPGYGIYWYCFYSAFWYNLIVQLKSISLNSVCYIEYPCIYVYIWL